MRIEPLIAASINEPVEKKDMSLLTNVPPNLVQSIRAFRVPDLQCEAAQLGQHFLYAYCADAVTKSQVLTTIAQAFLMPRQCGKNFDTLSESLTALPLKADLQPGFLVVLEQLPNSPKFDKEARETLLDVFRDAADFWADKKVAFRVFYSFQ
jgi:Barstar (barnase inhibitor)